MEDVGFNKLQDISCGDELDGQDEAFEDWAKNILKVSLFFL